LHDNENIIAHDAIDAMVYQNLISQAAGLKSVLDEGAKVLKTFTPLGADVFYSLYKPSPELSSAVAPEYLFNREEVSKLMDSPAYKELRDYTVLDEFGAGLGCKALLEALVKQLKDNPALQDIADKVNQISSGDAAQNQQLVDEIESALGHNQSRIRRIVDSATGSAVQEVEEVADVVTSWGLDKGGFERLPLENKLAILAVLKEQKKFKDMGKMVGRLRNIAIGSRKVKVDQSKVELHSITSGNDISRLLPQELISLRRPTLKLDFYRRYTEKQLMQYDLRQNEQKGQGPIICLIDTSGSMRKESRESWSKAVALGLAEIAARERRGFAYALFAGPGDELICGDFGQARPSPEQLLTLAQSFIGGGTDFEKPLSYALDKIKESKFSQADVVMITDGECQLGDAFVARLVKEKAAKGFRIYSVLIGGSPHELSRWSDEVWSVHDLLDDTVACELFNKL